MQAGHVLLLVKLLERDGINTHKSWMIALDRQMTSLRHAVRKGIPSSVRREARLAGIMLAMIDDSFRKKKSSG